MAVIYNDYCWDHEIFNRTECLTTSLVTPIPLVSSPYSGYGFVGEAGNGVIRTLTFRTAGTVEVELLCYNVLYKSSQIHGDSGTYSISYGSSTNTQMYVELYTTGTNNCVYRKSVQAPGPGSSMNGEDYVSATLNVTTAGTYDLKIRCQTSYGFVDLWSEYEEEQLYGGNVSEMHVEWGLYINATDNWTQQTYYVDGYVYDDTGMEAILVTVYLKEQVTIGTTTNASGYYKLGPLTPAQLNTCTLIVSSPGFKTIEFPLQGRDEIDFYLELEEDDPVVPEPDPEPEKPNLPGNKIATVQNIVDFLTGGDKTSFYNDAVSRGYTATKCPPIWIVDAIIQSTNVSLSIPSFTNSTKNKLVKYSDLAEGLYTMRLVDFDKMIDYYGISTDYHWYIANEHSEYKYDGSQYPTTNLYYGEEPIIVGTKEQWENLYNHIYDEEAESNEVILLDEEGNSLYLQNSFYDALYELAFGTAKQQDVYISQKYTLTIQDWEEWVGGYSNYDYNWVFAENIDGPFFDGDDYPTSNLYYYYGDSDNTITGYIWQWQNLIDYVYYNLDGEWEYLGLAVPDEKWTDSYNFSNVSTAIQDIVNEEQNQVANFLDATTVAKSVTVEPTYSGGWVLDNTNNPSTSLYNMYKSNTNKGVSNSVDMMKVTFKGYDSFTIYIRSYGETYWDYVVASSLNYVLPTTSSSYPGGSTSSPTMSGAAAMTKNNSQSGTALSYYTPVTYSNLDPNTQYYITVAYRKDGSGNQNDDRGYVLIPKTSSTGTFSISPTSKSLTSSAQTFAVSVTNTTGKTYSVSSNVSWITVYNNSPNISVSANTSTSSRYGTVTFTCNGMSRTVSITQSGSSSTYSIPIYYVQKGWCDEEDFEIDARLSASFTGSYNATICNKLAITDGWGQGGRGDSRSIINTFNISASQLSNTYLNFWGYDNAGQEGRIYVVKVSADGERELVSSILYVDEFGGSSVSPSIRIWMSNVQQGDSFEIWFEQGDTTYGIDNSL